MADVRNIHVVYMCNLYRIHAGKFVFCENLQFVASLHHPSEIFIDDNMMCISLFSYGSPVVVPCMEFRLGMGWVGSWVHKFTRQWVGLDLYVCGLGWVVSYENGPMDNSGVPFPDKTIRPTPCDNRFQNYEVDPWQYRER